MDSRSSFVVLYYRSLSYVSVFLGRQSGIHLSPHHDSDC
jgi:hypothetical protein